FETGETVSDAIAAILRTDPDWSRLPEDTPSHIRKLLRRCLQKDPQKRLPHIGVARIEIDEDAVEPRISSPPVLTPVASRKPWWKRALAVAGAGALVGVAATAAWILKRAPSPPPV